MATAPPVRRRRPTPRRRQKRRGRTSFNFVLARSAASKQSTCDSMDCLALLAMTNLSPFHLAFPVDDLAAARRFYGELLGCPEGRSADHWVDFDFFGHQIVAHLAPELARSRATNPVDGEDVPVPHFGVVLAREQWDRLAERLRS